MEQHFAYLRMRNGKQGSSLSLDVNHRYPNGVRKDAKDLRSGVLQESGMGYRVPFCPSMLVFGTRQTYKNVVSNVGSRGSVPWCGLGRSPIRILRIP